MRPREGAGPRRRPAPSVPVVRAPEGAGSAPLLSRGRFFDRYNPRMPRRTLLSWSSGKDSAWALHILRKDPTVDVVGLFTTVNETHDRVAMHGVRNEVLRAQARAAGLPLEAIPIPAKCTNENYETAMRTFVGRAKAGGIGCMAFGDLFLEDIRAYREKNLAGTGIDPLFPLWGIPTDRLAREMVAGGLRARVVCVNPKQLSKDFAGREFDASFLADLPAGVDPCGEHGEFHTCVHGGPMFRKPLDVVPGEIVERDGFVFADLLLQKKDGPQRAQRTRRKEI